MAVFTNSLARQMNSLAFDRKSGICTIPNQLSHNAEMDLQIIPFALVLADNFSQLNVLLLFERMMIYKLLFSIFSYAIILLLISTIKRISLLQKLLSQIPLVIINLHDGYITLVSMLSYAFCTNFPG